MDLQLHNLLLAVKELINEDTVLFRNFLKDVCEKKTFSIADNLDVTHDLLDKLFCNYLQLNAFFKIVFDYIKKDSSSKNLIGCDLWNRMMQDFCNDTCFLLLTDLFNSESHTEVLLVLSNSLADLIENKSMAALIWKQCEEKPIHILNGKAVFSSDIQMHWTTLIKKMVSLPDIMYNKLQLQTSSVFNPDNYFATMGANICFVLQKIHLSLQNSVDCSLTFISQLFGKICSTGHAGVFYEEVLPPITTWVNQSPLLCRICSKLFLSLNDNQLEYALEPLLMKSKSPILLTQLFNDEVIRRKKMKLLLTHKFLLVRVYNDDIIPFNIIGYLTSKVTMENLFKTVLFKLLDVWSDGSNLKHSSYEQHLYITKTILIALSFLTQQQKNAWKSEMILKLMEGVQVHLQSPNEKIHHLAMVVAECLTSKVDQNGKQLKFDLEVTDEVKYLKELSNNPEKVIRERLASTISKESATIIVNDKPQLLPKIEQKEIDDLDSDDDLEPLNVNDDEENISVNGVKPPVYLRDCISGLLSSNDPNRQEASLKVLEQLVKKEPGDLKDVAVEIVKILLHLQDQYDITDFFLLRFNAMIAITVRCPRTVSAYLCKEFHGENYSINQRLDILEVIKKSVISLSKPSIDDSEIYRSKVPLPNMSRLSLKGTKPEWQQIVDERVKQKTRYISKGPINQVSEPFKNEFSTVAGLFFFPLLTDFGKKLKTCDMLGTESMLLGNFVYTLGVVLQAADGLQVSCLMAKSLFELIWSLRYHKEPLIRQSIIYALSMIVLHVPSFSLITELQCELFESRDWLKDVLDNDANTECQRLAASCIMLMEKTVKKEMLGIT